MLATAITISLTVLVYAGSAFLCVLMFLIVAVLVAIFCDLY